MNEETIIRIVRDIENAQHAYHCYAYARTIRNILIGNPNSPFRDCFKNRDYYGTEVGLRVDDVERFCSQLVREGRLGEIYTENGRHNKRFYSLDR